MEMLTITINNERYEYVDSISYQGKCYVALTNGNEITINEYKIQNDQIELIPLDDVQFEEIKSVMHL